MKLTSPEFEQNGKLPEKTGYMGKNVNPELEIKNVPETAQTLALILEDPDAKEPAGKIWVHWLTWNIPADTQKIDEEESPGIEGQTDFPKPGYNGPNPPDGEHELVFKIYALDKELELNQDAGREEFEQTIENHIVDEAELKAVYPYKHKTRD